MREKLIENIIALALGVILCFLGALTIYLCCKFEHIVTFIFGVFSIIVFLWLAGWLLILFVGDALNFDLIEAIFAWIRKKKQYDK